MNTHRLCSIIATALCMLVVALTTGSDASANRIISTLPKAHAPLLKNPGAIAVSDETDDPNDVAVFVFDNGRRKLFKFSNGTVEAVAGDGRECDVATDCGDGGKATDAQLTRVDSIVVVPQEFPVRRLRGAILLSDYASDRIRVVSPKRKRISTLFTYNGEKAEGVLPDTSDPRKTQFHVREIALGYNSKGELDGRLLMAQRHQGGNYGGNGYSFRGPVAVYQIDLTSDTSTAYRLAGAGSRPLPTAADDTPLPGYARELSFEAEPLGQLAGLAGTADGDFIVGTNAGVAKVKNGALTVVSRKFGDGPFAVIEEPWEKDPGILQATRGWIIWSNGQDEGRVAGPREQPPFGGFDGEDTAAGKTNLGAVGGIAMDSFDRVYYTDSHNSLVRKIHRTEAMDKSDSGSEREEVVEQKPIPRTLPPNPFRGNNKEVVTVRQKRLRPITQAEVYTYANARWYLRSLLRPSDNLKVRAEELLAGSQLERLPRPVRALIFQYTSQDSEYSQLWPEMVESARALTTEANPFAEAQASGLISWAMNPDWPTFRRKIAILNYLRRIFPEPMVRHHQPHLIQLDNQARWQLEEVNEWLEETE